MTPHEETWSAEEVIVMHERYDGQKEAREVLGSAAPEMARALLHGGHWRGGMWHVQGCDGYNVPSNCPERCGIARAALAKAGVL